MSIFTRAQRQELIEAKMPFRKRSAPIGRKLPQRGSSVRKVSSEWVQEWAPKILSPLADKIATMISDVAEDKGIRHYAVSYQAAKATFEKAAKPALVALLKAGDVADMTDYDGRSGEFDKTVILPGLKAVFDSMDGKYKGFGPLSIQMRLKKMPGTLPGSREMSRALNALD